MMNYLGVIKDWVRPGKTPQANYRKSQSSRTRNYPVQRALSDPKKPHPSDPWQLQLKLYRRLTQIAREITRNNILKQEMESPLRPVILSKQKSCTSSSDSRVNLHASGFKNKESGSTLVTQTMGFGAQQSQSSQDLSLQGRSESNIF